ncbi:cellulose binding domain-containing protein [Catellatospora vulcania]|uniref:cellulose binding domain-containing protein n=1 Tax=Catellatospora vulcania TaxID=1460450 RepID=UPI0012D4ADCC|nr:cellulose binding domain-containing protein [Catellatospora vulcania]
MNGIRVRLAAVACTATLAALSSTGTASAQPGGIDCRYLLTTYPGGFTATVLLDNTGPAVNGWALTWTFPADTTVQGVWQSRITQPGPRSAIAVNTPWNAAIPTNTTLGFGWTAAAPATDIPTDLTINGIPC